MVGSRFGQFEIIAKLGEGGMGVVYEALDHDLGRKVALKMLPPETAADPQRLERFRREARSVAALNHPGIVTIHGIESGGDKHFLVMELVEGQSLDRMIGDDGMALVQALEIAIPIAAALDAAHAKGVVHRDIKPANVMVTPDGQVKVLDFGLAKAAVETGNSEADETQAPTRTTPLTGEGVIVGTAPYMPPEQLQGREVDPRGDLFSFGVVLFEMVTGKRPFAGETRIAVASSILKDTPDSVSELRTGLPRHLGRIIQQCLEKDPDRRIQTARDVRNQLEGLQREIVTGESETAPPARPRRAWMAAAILGLAAIAVAAIVWRSSGPSGPAQPGATHRIVVLPFENQGRPDDEYFADGMTEEITSRLGAVQGVAVISRASAMRYKHERPALSEIAAELDVDYIIDGTIRWQRGADGSSRVRVTPQLNRVADDTMVWSEPYEEVLADIFRVQSDIARKVGEALGVTLREPAGNEDDSRATDNLEAYDAYLRANEYYNIGVGLSEHSAEILVATRLYDKALALDPDFALAHARRAVADETLYTSYADHSDERLARVRKSVERALELEPDLPEAHHAKGRLHMAELDERSALDEFRIALAISPSAEIYHSISWAQQNLALWDEAERNQQKAMDLDPHAGEYQCAGGGIQGFKRDYEEGLEIHDRALQLIPDRWCPYFCKANIFLNWDGDTKRAREFLEGLPPDIPLDKPPPMPHGRC